MGENLAANTGESALKRQPVSKEALSDAPESEFQPRPSVAGGVADGILPRRVQGNSSFVATVIQLQRTLGNEAVSHYVIARQHQTTAAPPPSSPPSDAEFRRAVSDHRFEDASRALNQFAEQDIANLIRSV